MRGPSGKGDTVGVTQAARMQQPSQFGSHQSTEMFLKKADAFNDLEIANCVQLLKNADDDTIYTNNEQDLPPIIIHDITNTEKSYFITE